MFLLIREEIEEILRYLLRCSCYLQPTITHQVISNFYSGMTTAELDTLAADIAASMVNQHPDYGTLASRIAISNLHKETKKIFSGKISEHHIIIYCQYVYCYFVTVFYFFLLFYYYFTIIILEVIIQLYNGHMSIMNKRVPGISEKYYIIIQEYADRLNSAIIYNRDFNFNYTTFKVLEDKHLLRLNGKVVERPQHMLMRVAVCIHGDDIDKAIETYNFLSKQYFVHAAQMLNTACTTKQQTAR